MLRIHFTCDDLARTSVAAGPDALWEIMLSGFRLREPDWLLELRPWIQRVHADPHRATRIGPGARLLSVLAPAGPYIPDFLTPDEGRTGLDAGLAAILATPRHRLHTELCRLGAAGPLPSWVRGLAAGDVDCLTRLVDGLRAYHDAAIAPHHELIAVSVDTDRARRARTLLDTGVAGLFHSMRPLVRWQPPVLEVRYPVDQDLHLDGRGLRLVPSYFCDRLPISLADPDLPPVLIYPIDRECRWQQAAMATGHPPLDALIGATRAAALRVLDTGLGTTTTELARRLHTSPASASRHTQVLRDAGLITTHRHGTAVLHTRTPLGTALLEHDR